MGSPFLFRGTELRRREYKIILDITRSEGEVFSVEPENCYLKAGAGVVSVLTSCSSGSRSVYSYPTRHKTQPKRLTYFCTGHGLDKIR